MPKEKKILVYRWKAYNYRDVIEQFKRMDYNVVEISQELLNYDVDEKFAQRLEDLLRKDEFQFVFSINCFALISNVCQELQIPYVCWSCDCPMISMYHNSVYNDCNRIFVFDRVNYEEFKAMGVEHIYYLPLAVNPRRIQHMLQAQDVDARPELYQNDISFVGSLYEKNSYDEIEHRLPEYLRGYFECLMDAQRDLQGVNIVDRMLTVDILEQLQEYFHLEQSSKDSFSDLNLIFSVTVLGFKIAQLQRKSILTKLSQRHQVGVYTSSDVRDLLMVDYKGAVDYWTQMPKVFANSKINLNATIPNIKTGIALRAWDVMACGGFLLSNFQAEYPMYFDLDQDLVCYYSEDDLLEKAEFYLKHEEERQRIAKRGYEKVVTYHTYEERMKEMMRVLSI